ncbi:head-tail connector protein [Oryzibacter oryziterrae]|uniref:head-tail connector protein n=1 Tax=Oryzibacter oryziterrae TaxID=2766474 RepID=UPI001F42C644|nr:phage head-tail connector protein [Oryzibacter oryziterrae]
MATRLLSAPVVEPITLAELKAHLNLDGSGEDEVLTTLVVVARATIERLTGKLLLTQSWRITLDRLPPGGMLRLPLGPVQTVSAVRVYDAYGTATTWPGSSYTLDLVGEPARLLFNDSLPNPGKRLNGIEIDVVAGFGATAASVPAELVQAVKLLAAHWYATRGDGPNASSVPDDVLALALGHRGLKLIA